MKKDNKDFNNFKENFLDFLEFIIEKKRYFASGIIMIFIILLLVFSDDKHLRLFPKMKKHEIAVVKPNSNDNSNSDDNDNSEQEQIDENLNPLILNKDKDLNKFIKNYYKALEKADVKKLRKYVDVLSDIEINSIRQKAKVREAHKNIKVYTKNGPKDDSYLAYVYLDLKFRNIKTMVPGIEPLYIKKDTDGYVIINSMNSTAEDLQYTNEAEESEDVVELFAKANDAYKEACKSDKELLSMLKESGYELPVPDNDKDDKSKKDSKNKSESKSNEASDDKKDTKKDNDSNKSKNNKRKNKKDKDKVKSKKDNKKKNKKNVKKSKNKKSLVGNTYILTDSMRLRTKKSTSSLVKASGIKDDRVRVVKEYKKSKWIKVQLIASNESTYGYMKKDVLLSNAKLKK